MYLIEDTFSHVHVTLLSTQCFYAGTPGLIRLAMLILTSRRWIPWHFIGAVYVPEIWMSAKINDELLVTKLHTMVVHNVWFLVTCLQSGGRDREEGYRTRHSDQHVHTLTHVPSQPAAAAGCMLIIMAQTPSLLVVRVGAIGTVHYFLLLPILLFTGYV